MYAYAGNDKITLGKRNVAYTFFSPFLRMCFSGFGLARKGKKSLFLHECLTDKPIDDQIGSDFDNIQVTRIRSAGNEDKNPSTVECWFFDFKNYR